MTKVMSIPDDELLKALQEALGEIQNDEIEPGTITRAEFQAHFGLSHRGAAKRLNALVDEGVLIKDWVNRPVWNRTQRIKGYRLAR